MQDHAARAGRSRVCARALRHASLRTLPLGYEAARRWRMTVDRVRRLHAAMFAPAGATLVRGRRSASEDELLDRAAKPRSARGARRRRRWRSIQRTPARCDPPRDAGGALGVVSRPGAAQSELRIGHVVRARDRRRTITRCSCSIRCSAVDFVSRLNLNLREEKGYTYGVRTGFNLRRGIGPFVMQTSVGTDVTVPAIHEVAARAHATSRGARPVTTDEAGAGACRRSARAIRAGSRRRSRWRDRSRNSRCTICRTPTSRSSCRAAERSRWTR